MNGAIKITIDGNVIGLKFAYPAIRMFLDEMAAKSKFYYSQSDGGDPMMTVEGIAKFIQCGYKNDCMIKEVDEVFNYEFFYNWVEQKYSVKKSGSGKRGGSRGSQWSSEYGKLTGSGSNAPKVKGYQSMAEATRTAPRIRRTNPNIVHTIRSGRV